MSLIDRIKSNEGFKGYSYKDTLGFHTIGYGTKLPLTKEEASLLLEHRLKQKITELESNLKDLYDFPEEIQDVLIEMSYQLGVSGVLKFKKTLQALRYKDYKLASKEMINSRWYKQTPNRVQELADIVRSCKSI